VNPGKEDVCNLKDDDCSGETDDGVECGPCVPITAPSGAEYVACNKPRAWQEAHDDCVSQGGDLASIHNEADNAFLYETAFKVFQTEWWIGINDIEQEGSFAWSDGTPVDFTAWNDGEPNNAGGAENCGHFTSWAEARWNDIPCGNFYPYFCNAPP
jgi:hypothetical protein